jgi:hypothetical protein
MSVYGSLVGVAAFESGIPSEDSGGKSAYYHTSCSLIITASMFLMLPVCQLTVLTMTLGSIPKAQMRETMDKYRVMIVLAGPLHLVGAQIFIAGIVMRIISLELPSEILYAYLIPIRTVFVGCWSFNVHTMAVGMA